MSSEENRQIIIDYNNALHKGAPKTSELIDQYVDDPELKRHIEVFETAFPGYTLEVKAVIAQDDQVMMNFIFHGIYQSEMFGIPPQNQTVSVPGMIQYGMKDGKIINHQMIIDTMSLMEQIGAFASAIESYQKSHTIAH